MDELPAAELVRQTGATNSQAPVASVYAALGDQTRALEWLEKAVENRSADVLRLAVDPAFDSLRLEPRYLAMQQRLGL